MKAHLQAFQGIADRSRDNRAAGTLGYKRSVQYVAQQLRAAGYRGVQVQNFDYELYVVTGDPSLSVAGGPTYEPGEDIGEFEYAANGTRTGRIVPAGGIVIPATELPSSQSGCVPADFPPQTAGNIALIQRGTCTFQVKVQNAEAAGAVGAIIFNEGNPGRTEAITNVTLGTLTNIPVIPVSYAVGVELFGLEGSIATLSVSSEVEVTESQNVIVDTRFGDRDTTVVVGAHLDSVQEGPGINDNGSGTAAILEIARQMQLQGIRPTNRVRFAFWGAEESGLIGSNYYVANLTEEAIEQIALNLNFDMLGSPNFVRFVYDGDGDIGPEGPPGSAQIEDVFLDYFRSKGLATYPTAFDGRSDYLAFITAGIPAGGLFSGAEGIKTPGQARRTGGTAGVAYDVCYHQACDTIANVNDTGLLQLARGAADSTYFWATREQFFPNRMAAASARRTTDRFDYLGPFLRR